MSSSCFLLFGPPGSGKGTFSDYATRIHGYLHLSSGDVVREEIQNGTALGKQIDSIVSKGELLPSSIMQQLIASRIDELIQTGKPFIIDGYGRTPQDLQFLFAHLEKHQLLQKTTALFLETPDSECKERVLLRLLCSKCHTIFNQATKPSNNVCDRCGGTVTGRLYDSAEVIEKRLLNYRLNIAPVYETAKTVVAYKILDTAGTFKEVHARYAQLFS